MNRIRSSQHGVALLEVLIAILVMAVGIIGAIGLQAKATAAMSDAGARAEAVIASERLIGLMWNDQQNLTSYAWSGTGTVPPALSNWLTATQESLPNATVNITITPQAAGSTANQVAITISWQRRSTDPISNHTLTATLAQTL